MSKAKKKKDKDKKDGSGKDEGGDGNGKDNSSETKIATLTFSATSLTAQLFEERENYELLKKNSDKFSEEFMKKIESQQEIILFLEKTIHDLKKKCTKYEEQHKSEKKMYSNLQQEKDDVIEDLNAAHKETVDALKMKIHRVEDELKDLIEFKENKLLIEKELLYYKNMLEKEKKERESREAFLERRFLSERERLKKEMLNKIRETKLRLLSMTEDQLHTTTKRTIMENEQMTIELQYQSKETEKLIKKTNATTKNVSHLKRQIDLHRNTETMLAKRTYFLQKLVDQLHAQIKRMKQKEKENNTQIEVDGDTHSHSDGASNKEMEMIMGGHLGKNTELLLEEAEMRGERKAQLKIKKLKNENRMLQRRLIEAQKTVDRLNQQNTKDITSIYKTNSEKFLMKWHVELWLATEWGQEHRPKN